VLLLLPKHQSIHTRRISSSSNTKLNRKKERKERKKEKARKGRGGEMKGKERKRSRTMKADSQKPEDR
jgi:hypothetical protein